MNEIWRMGLYFNGVDIKKIYDDEKKIVIWEILLEVLLDIFNDIKLLFRLYQYLNFEQFQGIEMHILQHMQLLLEL